MGLTGCHLNLMTTQEQASMAHAALRLICGRPTSTPRHSPCTLAITKTTAAAEMLAATTARPASRACATRMVATSSTDSGKIKEVKQFYTQNGKTIDHPHYTINGNKHNSINDAMCKDWVADTKDGTNFVEKGGMQAVDDIFTNGAVLVMSFWDDHYANMLWLDSLYPITADPIADKGSYRGPCSKTSGNAQDLEKNVPNSTVRFSDIRWGPIGSTVARSDDITV